MTNAQRRSPADRDRAVARVRTITIASALGSLAAVAVFGAAAAVSYDGTTSNGIVTAAVTSASGTTSQATTSPTPASATTAATASGSTGTTTTPTIASTNGSAHATSGGS